VDRSKSREGGFNEQRKQLKPLKVGMQVPCGLDTEMPKESALRSTSEISWRSIPRSGSSKREQGLGGHLQADHVHMMIAIPPKYAVSRVVGYLKGKSAIHIARTYLGQKKNYGGMSFWARGYFVSTVGTDEEVVRAYIREQEKEDQRVEQLTLFK